MEFDIKNWKKFKLTELFEIKGSKTTPLLELQEYGEGRYPYVTTRLQITELKVFMIIIQKTLMY